MWALKNVKGDVKGYVGSKTIYDNKSRFAIRKAEPDLSQLFIERGFITEQECFTKLKQVQREYKSSLDSQIGIYRDAENGPCEVCMMQGEDREERMIDKAVVFD